MTYNQLIKGRQKRSGKRRGEHAGALKVRGENKPQVRGMVMKVFVRKPKKPNSALRNVARIQIISSRRIITAFIPGGEHDLQEHSIVLVRGGRVKDLPGILYKVVRGKYDARMIIKRSNARSKYGIKKK